MTGWRYLAARSGAATARASWHDGHSPSASPQTMTIAAFARSAGIAPVAASIGSAKPSA